MLSKHYLVEKTPQVKIVICFGKMVTMDKAVAENLLSKGLAGLGNPDYLFDFFDNFDNSCEFIELIPLLKKVANENYFYYCFDDNSSGGFPHGTGEGVSFREKALAAIEIIKNNWGKLSPTAQLLKNSNPKIIDSTLNQIIASHTTDLTLIPILEKIVEEDVYLIPGTTARGFRAIVQTIYLGEKAKDAIRQINQNIQNKKA